MSVKRTNRWSLAFADLSLLMLGFVVLSFVRPTISDNISEVEAQSERFEWDTAVLFQPGEAMLNRAGKEKAEEIARSIGNPTVQMKLSVSGSAAASARLEQWELSAARMASFARALKAAGVDESVIIFGGQSKAVDHEQQQLILSIGSHSHDVTAAYGTGFASQ